MLGKGNVGEAIDVYEESAGDGADGTGEGLGDANIVRANSFHIRQGLNGCGQGELKVSRSSYFVKTGNGRAGTFLRLADHVYQVIERVRVTFTDALQRVFPAYFAVPPYPVAG